VSTGRSAGQIASKPFLAGADTLVNNSDLMVNNCVLMVIDGDLIVI
jgi:hypothetical protein